MSICSCEVVGIDGPYDPKHKRQVEAFLNNLAAGVESGLLADSEWSLLAVGDMAKAGNTVEDIAQIVPFRGGACPRTMRCCGVCTRQCHIRCVQDCLHRLYMWKKLVGSTPPDSEAFRNIPLGIRLIVKQKFTSHAQLSDAVGEILSQQTNTKIKEYMKNANLRPEENPYKVDYAPAIDIDVDTGKRRYNPDTGEMVIVNWPETGLCPFCLPNVTIDARHLRYRFRGTD